MVSLKPEFGIRKVENKKKKRGKYPLFLLSLYLIINKITKTIWAYLPKTKLLN
jgi:hypothetical protein